MALDDDVSGFDISMHHSTSMNGRQTQRNVAAEMGLPQ